MNNPTIIYICSEYPIRDVKPGGIGMFVYSIAKALSKLGWAAEVWGMYDIGKFRVDYDGSIKIFQYPKLIKYSPIPERTALFFFKQHLSKRISHQSNVLIEASDWEALLVPANIPVPLCIRFHDSHAIAFKKGLLSTYPKRRIKAVSKVIKRSNHCVFVSKFVEDNIHNTYGVFPEHYSISYNGVDTDFFQPELSAQKMYRVVFIGSMLAQKGIFELADAWNIINSVIPKAQLHIAGKGDVDPVCNKIKSEYRHNVVFHGTLGRLEIRQLLNSAQICVFPSHWEAFSLSVLEAMSCGKTVVYSNIMDPEIWTVC